MRQRPGKAEKSDEMRRRSSGGDSRSNRSNISETNTASSSFATRAAAGALVLALAYLVFLSPSSSPSPSGFKATSCTWCEGVIQRVEAADTAKKSQEESCRKLSQADFAEGTVILAAPDSCVVLSEDIVFHPAPDNDFRANRAPYAGDPAFVLDFPAAILVQYSRPLALLSIDLPSFFLVFVVIISHVVFSHTFLPSDLCSLSNKVRAPGVTIDLGGFEIRQSVEHYIQQRFFAAIEIQTPFLENEGAADFVQGTTLTPAPRFTLRNGRIGLSSHHGVHGNDASTVLIEDVDIRDYEVAAIGLNNARDVVLRRVRALGTFERVPVLGTYSSARFLLPFVSRALGLAADSSGDEPAVRTAAAGLAKARARLQGLMDQTLQDIVARGEIDGARHEEANTLFGNPSGRPDGSAGYGIVVHVKGHASNGFECSESESGKNSKKADETHDVVIADCEVLGTRLRTVEVPVLEHVATAQVQQGPAGDVLRVADIIVGSGSEGSEGNSAEYSGTALSDAKIALQVLVNVLGEGGKNKFGYCAIHGDVLAWARGEAGARSMREAVSSGDFRYVRNGDSMFHVNKGAVGIRIAGGTRVAVVRTRVSGVSNTGSTTRLAPLPGETQASAAWTDGHNGGHPMAEPQAGYGGADAVGIAVEAAADVVLDTVELRDVVAREGWASGLRVFHGATATSVHDATIANVSVAPGGDTPLKFARGKKPRAAGISVARDAAVPRFSGELTIKSVQGPAGFLVCDKLLEPSGLENCKRVAPATDPEVCNSF
jgi:hypothetical protein